MMDLSNTATGKKITLSLGERPRTHPPIQVFIVRSRDGIRSVENCIIYVEEELPPPIIAFSVRAHPVQVVVDAAGIELSAIKMGNKPTLG